MWTPNNSAEPVWDRDVDLLLLEEFCTSPRFREWFLRHVLEREAKDSRPVFLGALHSVFSEDGKSDLLAGFQRPDGHQFAVLMENKIDERFEADQAERYHRRGLEGIQRGLWHSFMICIVAPQAFLNGRHGVDEFEFKCPYEALEQWFLAEAAGELKERGAFKAKLVRMAVAKNRRRTHGVKAAEVTAFWMDYWSMLASRYPVLQLAKPGGKGPDADWPVIKSGELPRGTVVLHKWAQGRVDLQLNGLAAHEEEVRRLLQPVLPREVSLVVTGRSMALRMEVPRLDRWRGFASQADLVTAGLEAAVKLVETMPEILKETGVLGLAAKKGRGGKVSG